MADGQSGRLFHESTKHGTPPPEPGRLVDYRRLDPGNRPRPFKEYRDFEQSPLPRELVESSMPATAVLSGESGDERPIDARMLMTLLFLCAGVTRTAGPPGHRTYFRVAMSAGNLHPVEVYVVSADLDGVEAGVYHFAPLGVALTRLRQGDHRSHIGIDTPVALVLTGIPWRTTWKYGERGWRHLYWDAGTMLANLLAVADAHGLECRTLAGFEDERVSRLLGIDGETEMPLAVILLGASEHVEESVSDPEPLVPDVAPVAARPIRLPLLQDAQRGSVLEEGEVAGWRRRGSDVAHPAISAVTPPKEADRDPIEAVILRRGSTRRMVRQPIVEQKLEWPMFASIRPVGLDVAPEGSLLHHYLNVHAVEGLDAGAYRHTGEVLRLVGQAPSLRELSASLCLGQALGGNSAYTVFHCAELEPILDTLGPRGYRVAQLEAGVVSGRLALCAFAMGLGATGLTFFDDAVSHFFSTSAQPMLVTSVGVSSTAPAPYGSPGEPAELSR